MIYMYLLPVARPDLQGTTRQGPGGLREPPEGDPARRGRPGLRPVPAETDPPAGSQGIDLDRHPEYRRSQTFYEMGIAPPYHEKMADIIIANLC